LSIGFLAATLSTAVEAKGYGAAGCGLGSLVFEPTEGFSQVFAATTNGTFGSQTFGISSGTSNCETKGHASIDIERFFAGNRNALENDVARGSGETLTAFAQMLGCKGSDSIGANLKSNYDSVFSAGSSNKAATESFLNSISKDADVKASCSSIG
jgi:hypothetical protein